MKKYSIFLCSLINFSLHASTAWDIIQSREDLRLFKLAVQLAKAENIMQATEFMPKYGIKVPFIIFAPTNEALTNAGFSEEKMKAIASQEGFIQGGAKKARTSTLRTLVKQHVCVKANEQVSELRPEYQTLAHTTIKTDAIKARILAESCANTYGMIHIVNKVLPQA